MEPLEFFLFFVISFERKYISFETFFSIITDFNSSLKKKKKQAKPIEIHRDMKENTKN